MNIDHFFRNCLRLENNEIEIQCQYIKNIKNKLRYNNVKNDQIDNETRETILKSDQMNDN